MEYSLKNLSDIRERIRIYLQRCSHLINKKTSPSVHWGMDAYLSPITKYFPYLQLFHSHPQFLFLLFIFIFSYFIFTSKKRNKAKTFEHDMCLCLCVCLYICMYLTNEITLASTLKGCHFTVPMSLAKCSIGRLDQSFLEFLEQTVKLKTFLVHL